MAMTSSRRRSVGSVTVTSVMVLSTSENNEELMFGFLPRYESRLSFTVSASSGEPSVKVMPDRSLIVHSVKSALGVTDSAR